MSKAKRLITIAATTLSAVALTGCSGINASHSVSPASFFLPGLIQHEAKPAAADPYCGPVKQVALLVDPIN